MKKITDISWDSTFFHLKLGHNKPRAPTIRLPCWQITKSSRIEYNLASLLHFWVTIPHYGYIECRQNMRDVTSRLAFIDSRKMYFYRQLIFTNLIGEFYWFPAQSCTQILYLSHNAKVSRITTLKGEIFFFHYVNSFPSEPAFPDFARFVFTFFTLRYSLFVYILQGWRPSILPHNKHNKSGILKSAMKTEDHLAKTENEVTNESLEPDWNKIIFIRLGIYFYKWWRSAKEEKYQKFKPSKNGVFLNFLLKWLKS